MIDKRTGAGKLCPKLGSLSDAWRNDHDLILGGNVLIEVDKSLSPSNDLTTVSGILTNAGTGTVTVTNLGPALAVGDSFQIFNQAVLNGQALTVFSTGGEVWTNQLAVDGSIAVVSVTPPVPATNLMIQTLGPTSFSLSAIGAANSLYGVLASTNLALPLGNWWLIGTTMSDPSGLIEYVDAQATNTQRFYRFVQ